MQFLEHIDYGDPKAPLKVISLHGFPSIRSKQNRELAKAMAEELGCRVRVVLYPGLSTSGLFSFKATISALLREFPDLANDPNKAAKVGLLGHSFGGFCAILLAANFPNLVNQVVLLSPLLKFNSSINDVAGFFKSMLGASPPGEVNTLTPHELGQEFHDLSKDYAVEELISALDSSLKVKLMQARIDGVTPTQTAEEFRQYFKCNFDFELVDQDHSFLIDRPKLAKKIAENFK